MKSFPAIFLIFYICTHFTSMIHSSHFNLHHEYAHVCLHSHIQFNQQSFQFQVSLIEGVCQCDHPKVPIELSPKMLQRESSFFLFKTYVYLKLSNKNKILPCGQNFREINSGGVQGVYLKCVKHVSLCVSSVRSVQFTSLQFS